MSGSGFRGRGFGPRGARTNGPTNGFGGPRFPHPSFNHPRPPHRLPGPDKWVEGPNFAPWKQNKNFHPRSQYRGNLQFRPNGRGRAVNSRGVMRFSGPGRPPAPQFYNAGFVRNPGPRIPLLQEEQVEDKSGFLPQAPLLGSEEERQQKISDTADKLKQKLSSITEEELTNFWEDDLSVLPNNGSGEDSTQNKGIPELRHEPPELDLTFTDFKDIGRVDCNNSKFENVDDKDNADDITVIFEEESANILSTDNEITIINDSNEESLNILDSVHNNILNDSDILLDDDQCEKQMLHEFSDSAYNLKNLHLECDNVTENLMCTNLDDVDGKFTGSNLDENITNKALMQPTHDLINEKSLDLNDIETPILSSVSNEQDVSQVDFSQNQDTLQIDVQDTNIDIQQSEHEEINLQIPDNMQMNIPQEEVSQSSMNASASSPNNSFNPPPLNEEIQSNIACDLQSSPCPNYNEHHKVNEDKTLNTPPHFQPRAFNIPPRFGPRIPGPRCRWTFQQNGKNLFFRGPQRLPFHGNRMPGPRHMAPFATTDLVPAFDPRAPPPFTPNLPASSHDSQHHPLVPFSSSDLPPTFDPSEPPPNMRSMSANELSNRQEIMQPPPVFDPREPPPTISNVSEKLPEFNPQQPPPKIHKQEETLQPPPIFDPRLSSQERSNLLAPLDSSGSNLMTMNLMETSQMTDFNMSPVTTNFSQLPPMSIPPHQGFINNIQLNFQPILPQTGNGQVMIRDFALPLPSINISDAPPPLPKESSSGDSNQHQSLNMDDGLEDMQEAMEFAKQVMNMTEEMKSSQDVPLVFPDLPLMPSEIPVPIEGVLNSSSMDQGNTRIKKKKENKSKKSKQNIVYGPEPMLEKQEDTDVTAEERSVQDQSKIIEDTLLTGDQIRPKVVFNLNYKTKKIHKAEEWHRPSTNNSESKETQQAAPQNHNKEKTQSKRYSLDSDKKNKKNLDKNQQKEHSSKKNTLHCTETAKPSILEKSKDTSYNQDYSRDLDKIYPHSSNTPASNNTNVQKKQKSKKGTKKAEAPTSESSWKNRVINRFLKMSKNDICNMVNNSSLRKFDIAMKHLVKERRSSLSLEMRNTEDEKMKEYDREEFMNQLNAMLDPGAVVGITDLPTEFIHHLSEVLQLDPMPFELEAFEKQTAHINTATSTNESDTSKMLTSECLNEESIEVQSFSEYSERETAYAENTEDTSFFNMEEPIHCLSTELNLNITRRESDSSRKSSCNRSNPETEIMYKKQQPLFNEADLDNILSEVTEKTKNIPNIIPSQESRHSFETYRDSFVTQPVPVPETFECNTYPRISTKTAADLDDIFSAGIARVKLLSKNVDFDHLRARKSSSEDRSTYRTERYEKWNRKEREDPDAFRNLTKEEWEAKYGSLNSAVACTNTIRKNASNSAENLSRDNNYHSERYCSSDSPMRHLSVSPMSREAPLHNPERQYSEIEELRRTERSESSSDPSTSSSSDSDEETVAPDVTKLLKVIKEKEKIAKKKSLNETIRDEVAAEIEKKWKEKSKHKERKSRKREKRKRDKKEKKKKEKKKRRKRNSYSNSSRSSDQIDSFRLLTEDEIKKEVVVKEEPVSSWEENGSFNTDINNTYVSNSATKTVESVSASQIDSQSLPTEKQVPVVTSDKTQSQVKGKPTVVSMVQPKTKAQLKQMPDPSDVGQRQIIEKPIEATKNSTSTMKEQLKQPEFNDTGQMEAIEKPIEAPKNSTSVVKEQVKQTSECNDAEQAQIIEKPIEVAKNNSSIIKDNEGVKEHVEKNKDSEVTDTNSKRDDTVPLINNSLNQTTTPTTVADVPQVEAAANKIVVSNSAAKVSTMQSTNNKSATISLTESKSGYRKIDIKAYKERRMKEQAKLKESSSSPVPLVHDLQRVLPVSKPELESLNMVHESRIAEIETCKVQIKDPRLAKVKSMTPSWVPPNKEVTEKPNLEEHQHTSCPLANKGAVQLRDTNESLGFRVEEKSTTRTVEFDLNAIKNYEKYRERKSNALPLSQKPKRDLEEFRIKVKSKIELEEKTSKKSPQTIESNKFKNIRSEGGKELKLKKEKAKKANEKKKSKSTVSKSSVTEQPGKHSREKVIDEMQKSSNISDTTQTETENSCDTHESLQIEKKENFLELQSTFAEALLNLKPVSCTNITTEHSNKQSNTHTKMQENNQSFTGHNEESMDVDVTFSDNQKVEDQLNKEIVEELDKETSKSQLTTDQIVQEASENTQIVDQIDEHASENQKIADQNEIARENGQSLLTSINEEINVKKVEECISTEASNENLVSSIDTESISTEKCIAEDKSVRNEERCVVDEPQSIDTNMGKDVRTKKIENLEDAAVHIDPQANSEIVNKKGSIKSARKDQGKIKSDGQSDLSVTDNNSKPVQQEDSQTNTVSSPDSTGSPFKGFLAESIEDDIREVSKLYSIEMTDRGIQENAGEDPKKWLEKCLTDKLDLKVIYDDKDGDQDSSEEQRSDEVGKSTLEQSKNDVNEAIPKKSENTSNLKAETREPETTKESETENTEERQASPIINIDSQDTFDNDSQPFIVLDEYIDDTDGKLIDKLSTLNLYLEDCIARDVDAFSNKAEDDHEEDSLMNNSTSPNFHEIDFKKLSEVFDKKDNQDNIEEEKSVSNSKSTKPVLSVELFKRAEKSPTNTTSLASKLKTESTSEILGNSKSSALNIPEISKECPFVDASDDTPKGSATSELSLEMRKAKQNHETSQTNLQRSPEVSNETRSETSMKLIVQIENPPTRSPNKSAAVPSLFERNVEHSEPKQPNCKEEKRDKVSETSSGEKLISVSPETETFNDKERRPSFVSEEKPKESDQVNEKGQRIFERLNDKETETSSDKEKWCSFTMEEAKSDDSDQLNEKRRKSFGKSSQKEALHRLKAKSKMKHKRQRRCNVSENAIKEGIKSDTVKIKYPSTKEAIMARMIEIDVEIHKLMTEKMTLYEMLTNGTPAEDNVQENNTLLEAKEAEIAVVRPRTPSALMSQLIQNIETSPVTNQCAKTVAESVSLKDSNDRHKISSRQEHHAERKGCLVPTNGSDDDEVMNYTLDTKSSSCRKRKRQKSERTVKWDRKPESTSDVQETSVERRQTNDATKSILKKGNTKSETTEQVSGQVTANECQPPEVKTNQANKIEAPSGETGNRTAEGTESQGFTEEIVRPSVPELNNKESSSGRNDADKVEMSIEKDSSSLNAKLPENRTPERSSIYSDDSTWDSLLQIPSGDDQRKPSTGLALLEETYRKEMAKSRRIRAEARKKRKRKVQNVARAEITLTPEEEDLPLSTLYAKKLYSKKKSNSQDQEVEKMNDDVQVWKNVDEVINAVAENRTEDLYVRSEEVQESDTEIPDTNRVPLGIEKEVNSETNTESKSLDEERTTVPSVSLNVEEVYEEPRGDKDKVSCEGNDEKVDDSKQDDLQSTSSSSKSEGNTQSSISHDFSGNEEQETNAETSPEDPPGTSENNTEPHAQQTVEIITDKVTEDVDACILKSNVSNVCGNENNLDIPKTDLRPEKVEEDEALRSKEIHLGEEVVNTGRNIFTDQILTTPENSETNDNSCELGTYKDVGTEEDTAKENSNSEIEETLKDTASSTEKEAQYDRMNEDDTSESSLSKEDHFISLKEQRGSQRRREFELLNKTSSEENNNRNRTSLSETQDPSKDDETLDKKFLKRKRGSSKTPLRRSSRNTEEFTKRIKKELGVSMEDVAQSTEQEVVQEKSFQTQFPSVSPTSLSSYDEEAENTPTNARKSRSVQRTVSRKETEVLPSPSVLKDEPATFKQHRRSRQHSMSQMLNCEVRLVDSKHTILKPDVNPNTLRKYGISVINSQPNCGQVEPLSCLQSTSAKDSPPMCAKRTATTGEFVQCQPSKLIKKSEDATRPSGEQINSCKGGKTPKSVKTNCTNDGEESESPTVEVMPLLTKEQVVVDISQDSEKPDIEIVKERVLVTKNQHKDDSGSTLSVIETREDKELPRTQYTVHKGPILDIKVFENSFLAASEDGRIYRYSQASNGILNIYKGHTAAVTCLHVYSTGCTDVSKEWMFSGSLDGTLRCYNVTTGVQVRDTADIGSPIQCMDEAWGIIFIGTKSGHVSRYHMKTGVIKGNSIQFSDKSVLALKATNEGPRRVLIVASRSQPITIRDAQTGLFLRTICGQKSHTVYSLMRDNSLIYCGTSSTSIPVFDFTNGEETMQYDAGVGIVCMRLYKQLLFAGCYDGNIYVFDTKDHRLVCSIPGPGNMLLSMEVIDNKIIAGSKDKRLHSWQVPWQVRALL